MRDKRKYKDFLFSLRNKKTVFPTKQINILKRKSTIRLYLNEIIKVLKKIPRKRCALTVFKSCNVI